MAKIDALTRATEWIAPVGSPTSIPGFGTSTAFQSDEAAGLALDRNGYAYVVAYDGTKDYPASGGQYRVAAGRYVFRIGPNGQASRYSIALDSAIRRIGAIAVDGNGNMYLTGSARDGLSTSAGAPYAVNAVAPGCIAPFVMKLDPSAQSVLYSTYLGYAGTQGERCGNDSPVSVFEPTGFAIAVDAAGNAYVTGQAEPGVRATSGSADTASKLPMMYAPAVRPFASHAFVTKLSASGSVVFTARLGGSYRERGTSIAIDGAGAVYVGGKTASTDFPATVGFGRYLPINFLSCPGLDTAAEVGFLAKLSADGRQIVYSGFLPASGAQLANCGGNPGAAFHPVRIAVDSSGRAFATGPIDTLRDFTPSVTSIRTLDHRRFLFVVDSAGQTVEYSTFLAGGPPGAMTMNASGDVIIVGSGATLQRLSVGSTPVEIVTPVPACAPAATLTAHVAGANNYGSVEFVVDGVSIGLAPVQNSIASKPVTVGPGIRLVRATYYGPSSFDGYSSALKYLPVNQAGACQ